ncbi:MAG: ScyD/ScyE family protein [Acidobacteriota bacterium]
MKSLDQISSHSNTAGWLLCLSAIVVSLAVSTAAQTVRPRITAGVFDSSPSVTKFLSEPGWKASAGTTVRQFAAGMSFPRGLKFGPGGNLYVAESGAGGTTSTVGVCTQVPAPVGPWTGGNDGRVSRLDHDGLRTTVADGFPSTFSINGGEMGVADIAFLGGGLYALVAGGGCSHGHVSASEVNGVYRINNNGSWSLVADISKFVHDHETAHPEADDFEPDGTPFSMLAVDGSLIVVESNHGQILKIETNGQIRRFFDTSSVYGHIVPTAMTRYGDNLYVSNLGLFPITDGSQQIFAVDRDGQTQTIALGLTAVLGVQFDSDFNLYALEMSTVDHDFPVPGSGRVVRINRRTGALTEIVTGLNLPTAMTFGPDGKLYISNWGFGPPLGEILQVTLGQ